MRLAQSEAPARHALCPAVDVTKHAHSICDCAALQTKDQDNQLLVRKLKERFERCASPPELGAAHLCLLKAGVVAASAMPPCQRLHPWVCLLPDKIWKAGAGAQGGPQDADSHSAVQQTGGECNRECRQPCAALRLEFLQEHAGGGALSPCLHATSCLCALYPVRCRACAHHQCISLCICTGDKAC